MTSSVSSTLSSSVKNSVAADDASNAIHLSAEGSILVDSVTKNKAKNRGLLRFGKKSSQDVTTGAPAPVSQNISTRETTQESTQTSWRVVKMQKEAGTSLRMLKRTIASQEGEESRKGQEADEALQAANTKLVDGNKRSLT